MAQSGDGIALADQPGALEDYRRELTGYCYRMLGSGFEADDAVQETMLRAWRSSAQFEGRSSVRSWLYRIATNVCLDMLRGRRRRARPMEVGPSSPPDESFLGDMLPEHMWVSPIADDRILPVDADPAEVVEARDTIRLAFVTALQHLPPRQRAALVGLLHEDAVQNMPPFAMWVHGAQNITTWMVQPGPSACRGSRLIPVRANGCPAFGQYKPDPAGGHAPWALQVLEISGGRIARMTLFLDTAALFPSFGLPAHLP